MTSLKKLIAVLAVSLPLAVSAQQAAPAAAPAPLYQIYGTLNLNGQYFEASKPYKAPGAGASPANSAGRFAVSTDSSNVGIRGTADTGQFGLGIVYQCETSAALDGDGIAGICGRNSRIGVSHEFGTLFYGNWDSPFKGIWYGTKGDDAFGNTDLYDAAGIMGSPGLKTKSNAGATSAAAAAPPAASSFNIRAANSIAYHSPKFMGLQVKAQVSPNERANDPGTFAPMLWSAGANYDRGPLSVFAAYERHDDWNGLGLAPFAGGFTSKTTVDTGFRAGAGYELGSGFGTTTVGAVFEMLSYTVENPRDPVALGAGAVKEYNRNAFMVNLKHRMGNHEFRARYEYADNGDCKLTGTAAVAAATCNADIGQGAQNYAFGYAYYLSKAAQAYAYLTKIENERNATYTFATGGPPAVQGAWAAGADPLGAGIGLRYAF